MTKWTMGVGYGYYDVITFWNREVYLCLFFCYGLPNCGSLTSLWFWNNYFKECRGKVKEKNIASTVSVNKKHWVTLRCGILHVGPIPRGSSAATQNCLCDKIIELRFCVCAVSVKNKHLYLTKNVSTRLFCKPVRYLL